MPVEFTKPLAISQCKSGDILVFQAAETTPYEFQLTVKDIDGVVLYGPVDPDLTRDSVHYWFITASSSFGMSTTLTYYQVVTGDGETNEFADEIFIVYVNDTADFEDYIVRGLGLAGHNYRRYDHVWNRGQLTSFSLKFYSTAAKLSAAIAGTSDDFLAEYDVTITYDNNYNRVTLTSVKQ